MLSEACGLPPIATGVKGLDLTMAGGYPTRRVTTFMPAPDGTWGDWQQVLTEASQRQALADGRSVVVLDRPTHKDTVEALKKRPTLIIAQNWAPPLPQSGDYMPKLTTILYNRQTTMVLLHSDPVGRDVKFFAYARFTVLASGSDFILHCVKNATSARQGHSFTVKREDPMFDDTCGVEEFSRMQWADAEALEDLAKEFNEDSAGTTRGE